MRHALRGIAAAATLLTFTACDGPQEAPRVSLPVVVDGAGIEPVTTALGYAVTVSSARLALQDLVFTVAGEVHTASAWERLSGALISTAYAHPGHYQGGEVTGALPGEFVVTWPTEDGRSLGVATLIAGTYQAVNFTFGQGTADGLGAEDPLVGHTAIVSGTATKGDRTTAFTLVVDAPEARALVGAPFAVTLGASSTGRLGLRLNTVDPSEGDTLFDALDFEALDGDGDGVVRIEPGVAEVEAAYFAFRRVCLTHDHYSAHHEE